MWDRLRTERQGQRLPLYSWGLAWKDRTAAVRRLPQLGLGSCSPPYLALPGWVSLGRRLTPLRLRNSESSGGLTCSVAAYIVLHVNTSSIHLLA